MIPLSVLASSFGDHRLNSSIINSGLGWNEYSLDMKTGKKALSGNRPTRRRNPISDCPLTAALAAVGGKWKMIIVYWLAESPKHFAAIRRAMPGISQKVLTEQLRELMSDEIVQRKSNGAAPATVTYSLTDYGQSLLPLVENVRQWGRGHIEKFTV
jgi:DNA-binding HxlR family transcriptional regulator